MQNIGRYIAAYRADSWKQNYVCEKNNKQQLSVNFFFFFFNNHNQSVLTVAYVSLDLYYQFRF